MPTNQMIDKLVDKTDALATVVEKMRQAAHESRVAEVHSLGLRASAMANEIVGFVDGDA